MQDLTLLIPAVLFLYISGTCWFSQGCAAYSPPKILVSYIVSWPIFLLQKIVFGSVNRGNNFDPVVFGKFGWLAVWIYYYLLVSVASYFVKSWTRNL